MPATKDASIDRGYAWVIPFCCCFINLLLFGIYRSYSLLYTAVISNYQANRSDATWPFSLCMTVIHLTGPVSGVLNSYFTVRTIMFSGCIFATIGIGLCYWATSVLDIVIFIGIVQGFGIGVTYVQNQAIINEYFNKYRATANGIALAGGTLGAFALSPLTEHCLEAFGLQKTFLILSLVTLLTLPVCLLLSPNKNEDKKIQNENLSYIFSISPVYLINFRTLKKHESNCLSIPAHSSFNLKKKNFEPNWFSLKSFFNQIFKMFFKFVNSFKQYIEVKPKFQSINHASYKSKVRKLTDNVISVLLNPNFMLICATHLAYFWMVLTYIMIIVDHAVDKGILISQAAFLIRAFAGGDLFGRLSSGWLMDNHLVQDKYIAMFSILMIGILLRLTSLTNNFCILVIITTILGLISGVIVILINILLCHYLGSEKSPLAFGLSSFFCGFATLARPMLVGYFRDVRNGSYDGLLNMLSILGFVSCALWFLEPFFNKPSKHQFDKIKAKSLV